MAQRDSIRDLAQKVGQTAVVRGWVYHRRTAGKLCFLEVRDGSGVVQAVVKKGAVPDAQFEAADKVRLESSVAVTGTVRADPRAAGGVELSVSDLQVVSACVADFPVGKKEHGIGFLMEERHLYLRSRRPWATLRVRAEVERALREWLDAAGYTAVDAPIFTPSAAEGTANLFRVDYFGEPAFLSQTGQLYMEAAAQSLGKVYCFGPTFRAEKSKTRRHLTEFWMLEPEIAFGDLDEVMSVMESVVSHAVSRVLERCRPELEALGRDVAALERVKPPFPRVSYDDALEMLKGTPAEIPWGEDFGAPQEDAVSAKFDRPILVHRFPTKIKAFYMKPDPARPEVVLGCDCVAPDGYGELIGGGERASDLAYLEHKIAEENLPKAAYEWYLDLRRYGACPSAGFGLGLERTVSWICGLDHAREAAAFPRTLHRVYP
ncbi:MAG: asparagine--tRNA ligase [Planctomycetes bacterium]|nr:asparagine--tRNA ligase [Planctomycetota bacterium]